MQPLTKADIARRQLGTALALYLQQKDPVSVHSLACAGCEIAEALASPTGNPFKRFTLAYYPEMSEASLKALKNQYWNAFKHSENKKGRHRDDTPLLLTFSERENEDRLFIGWFDFTISGAQAPVEAHVFTAWYLAREPERLMGHAEGAAFAEELASRFPGLPELSTRAQHRRLVRAVDLAKKDRRMQGDPKIDHRPLVLGPV